MKRIALVLLVLAGMGVAFGAGVATAPAFKFPWVHESEREKLNGPCVRTELEWRCGTKAIREESCYIVHPVVRLIELRAKPGRKGMVVTATIETPTGMMFAPGTPKKGNVATRILAIKRQINNEISKRFCLKDVAVKTIRVALSERAAGARRAVRRGGWDAAVPVR